MKINRSTLKAQEISKETMTPIMTALIKLYTKLETKGYIENVEMDFAPWNSGQEIRVTYKETEGFWKHTSDSDYNNTFKLCHNFKNVHFQPCSFFDTYLNDGTATFEGRFGSMEKDYESYRTEPFGNLSDAANQASMFKAVALNAINEAVNAANNLKSI